MHTQYAILIQEIYTSLHPDFYKKKTTFHVKVGCTSHFDIPYPFHFPKVGLHYMLLERNTLALALFSIGSFSPSPFFCLTSVIASC